MTSTTPLRGAVLAAVSALVLTLGACGSDGSPDARSAAGAGSPAAGSPATESPAAGSPAAGDGGSPAAGDGGSPAASGAPFGPGCVHVPAEGPGSFAGMSTAPVIAAAGANPALSALAQAAVLADLVDSLNGQQDVTVLAPANAAFDAVPADRRDALAADVPELTSVLTHHVVQGRLTPAQLAGEHTTLNNDTVTIAGSGSHFTISGDQTLTGQPATVLCGNVQTANATVYVIDQLLKPPAAG